MKSLAVDILMISALALLHGRASSAPAAEELPRAGWDAFSVIEAEDCDSQTFANTCYSELYLLNLTSQKYLCVIDGNSGIIEFHEVDFGDGPSSLKVTASADFPQPPQANTHPVITIYFQQVGETEAFAWVELYSTGSRTIFADIYDESFYGTIPTGVQSLKIYFLADGFSEYKDPAFYFDSFQFFE